MITQAYFEDIQGVIIDQIKRSKSSIQVAVAWLTDPIIFDTLCNKAEEGLKVELLLLKDDINQEMAPFNHNRLNECGGMVYFVPAQVTGSIMHHKFCIIDGRTVITGSYNWSKKAQLNDENIVVTEEAEELAQQFIKEFEGIKSRISHSGAQEIIIDYGKVIKRLEVIKSFVALEEEEEIVIQVRKLNSLTLSMELRSIVEKLEQRQFGEASRLIEEFIRDMSRLAVYDDGEVFGLQLEVKSLEVQLSALESELVEAEKLVHEFSVRHAKELGTLILELLSLKVMHAKDDEERNEAEQDEETYREGYEAKKDVTITELSKEDKQNISKMYREASLLCHPDKFSNESPEKQRQAEEMFRELADAYNNNDLQRVEQILANLKRGILSIDPKNAVQKKELLKARLEILKMKLNDLLDRLNYVKETEAYRTATENKDWDEYFENAKANLQRQIEDLKGAEAV